MPENIEILLRKLKKGLVNIYGDQLKAVYLKRLVSDYGVEANIEMDIAAHMINQAREFLDTARNYLEKNIEISNFIGCIVPVRGKAVGPQGGV